MLIVVVASGRGNLRSSADWKGGLESAYHMIPVHPGERHLLGVQCTGQLYFDTRLPFGLHSAPKSGCGCAVVVHGTTRGVVGGSPHWVHRGVTGMPE